MYATIFIIRCIIKYTLIHILYIKICIHIKVHDNTSIDIHNTIAYINITCLQYIVLIMLLHKY